MQFKKFSVIVLAIFILFSFSACQRDVNTADTSVETTTLADNSSGITSDGLQVSTTSSSVDADETTTAKQGNETTTSALTTIPADDPSMWTKAKIVEFYKNAAEKSNTTVKSAQSITLADISVNNGALSGVFQFVKPIISKLLSNNSTETDGITGGFKNLVAADVYEAKAYVSGNNIAIEMIMCEQTDGARGDALSGTVGHAISVVGDIGVVTDQLNDLGLPIEISDEYTTITYTEPIVKVLIDKNGNIINGIWSYTVDISLNNYKVGGTTVDNTSVVLNNVITVNGGFDS